MATYHIKANRTFTAIRQYAFLFTLTVAIGGLYYPKLGLLVIPVMIGLLLFSFFKGRYWCGNICAHGSLFDFVLLPLSRNTHIPKFFTSSYFVAPFFLMFFYRFAGKFIKVFSAYGSDAFWDKMGLIFVMSYVMVTISGGLAGLVISPRTWCQFCPMGVMQKFSYSLGKLLGVTKLTDEKVSISKHEMCHKCGKCARVCPMQLKPYTNFSENNQLDDANCIRCSTCVQNCPANILALATENTSGIIERLTPLSGYERRARIEAKILNIAPLKDDVIEYTFQFITPEKIAYHPGEFILVRIQEEPEEMFRAYSISSYDHDHTQVSVTIKNVPNGYGTEIIHNRFKEGDPVILEGPMGRELRVDPHAEKVLLIGGGIGITPFLPIVTGLSRNTPDSLRQLKLLYGVNKADEFLYTDEFERLQKENPLFEFIPTVAFDDDWNGRKGFVTDCMQEIPELPKYKIYMCGPKPMIDASVKKLAELGVSQENISYESA